jgi:hypothetical protein
MPFCPANTSRSKSGMAKLERREIADELGELKQTLQRARAEV